MVDFWNRLISAGRPEPSPPEPLSAERIDAGYRLFWTKTALTWDATHRQTIGEQVSAVIAAPDFEANALERRFHVEDLDDQAHSGASLVALIDVLRALDAFEGEEDN